MIGKGLFSNVPQFYDYSILIIDISFFPNLKEPLMGKDAPLCSLNKAMQAETLFVALMY